MSALPTPLSKWFYPFAFTPLLAGIVVTALVVVHIVSQVDELSRVPAPGNGDVTLPAGDLVGYSEYIGAGGDTMGADVTIDCQLADAASGAPLTLTPPRELTKYNLGGRSGRARFAVTVPRAGAYRLRCEGAPATIAIGRPVDLSITRAVIAGFAGLALSILGVIVVRLQRHRALRARGIDPSPKTPIDISWREPPS